MKRSLREHGRFLLINYFFALFFYMFLISNQLVNAHDGLWNGVKYSNYNYASLGRWLLYGLDQLHLQFHPEPVTSFLSLLFIVLTIWVIIDILNIRGAYSYIISLYIITSSIVTCLLSYRFTSLSYCIGIFLSAFSVWIIQTDWDAQWRLLGSIVCLVLSLGIYQANISCFAILFVFMLLYFLRSKSHIRDVFDYVIVGAIILIVSCILYKLIWDVYMRIFGIEASSYRGADNSSVISILSAFPQRVIDSYKYFFSYYFDTYWIKYNIFQNYLVFRLIFFASIVIMLIITLKDVVKSKVSDGIIGLTIFLIVSIPIAVNFVLLVAIETNVTILLTFGLNMVFPCAFGLICGGENTEDRKSKDIAALIYLNKENILNVLLCSFAFIVLFGNAYQSSVDMNVMYESKNITEQLMNRVIDKLEDNNLISEDRKYMFVGYPSDNKIYYVKPKLYDEANSYAKGGQWWDGIDCQRFSYRGILRDIGIDLNYIEDDQYVQILEEPFISEMPQFPNAGSILEAGEVVIVKVGN